ncbi:MAG: hypothetical protein ACKO96_06110 [Flammeovirgaceae bacterium]
MTKPEATSNTFFSKVLNVQNIILSAIAILLAIGTYNFSKTKAENEAALAELKVSAQKTQNRLDEINFNNELKFRLFTEVKEAVLKPDTNLQQAVKLLVTNMMPPEDSLFKRNLIYVLYTSPKSTPQVKAAIRNDEQEEVKFRQEEKRLANVFTIDVFYLEDLEIESKPRAQEIVNLLASKYPKDKYWVRLRKLTRVNNLSRGFNIDRNQIRFESNEEGLATEINKAVTDAKIFQIEQLFLRKNRVSITKDYLSIFVRNM